MQSANQIASVIVARSGLRLDNMRLHGLLYYVQAWHTAITDEPLFLDRIEAWRDGPVTPTVWKDRQEQATGQAATIAPLTDEESDLIDLVLATYGSMSGDDLSALTRVEDPWLMARRDLPPEAHGSSPIDTEAMAAFYRARRRLAGRTAADWAASGIHLVSPTIAGPVDVEVLLVALGDEPAVEEEDPWGGANLET